MSYQKTISVTNVEFERLKSGKHICIDEVRKFINIKCVNGDQNLIATVEQIGGIFTKSASIRKK